MISWRSRWRPLAAQKKASLRTLLAMEKTLKCELKRAPHPLFNADDVTRIVDMTKEFDGHVAALCAAVGFEPDGDTEATIVAVLTSPEGEGKARRVIALGKALEAEVLAWDEGKLPGREQLEHAMATPQVVRDRTLSLQFGAFIRQAEAVENLQHAVLDQHSLQFWVWDNKFHFAGQPEEKKA